VNIIDTSATRAKEKILAGAINPLRPYLPDRLVEQWCREAKHKWRERLWGPVVTVLACVWKQLQPTASARQVEDWAASLMPPADEGEEAKRTGSEFCAARGRVPLEVFQQIMRHTGAVALEQAGFYFKTLRVWLVDGTTVRLCNTPENEAFFGRARNQTRSSRSPVARIVVLLCAGCGAVLELALGPYLKAEWDLFVELLSRLPKGGLLLGDCLYSSYLAFALSQRAGSHILARCSKNRRGRRMKRLGYHDEIQEWRRPKASQVSRPDLLPLCAAVLQVRVIERVVFRRGYRSFTLRIATTLLDRHEYPAEQLIDLYLQRWNVELGLRELKTYYHLGHLSGKSPDIAAKEIYTTVAARNLVLAVMADSGEAVNFLSHTRARRLILIFCERMAWAPTVRLPALYHHLLRCIAQVKLVFQERPPQPRAIVQRPSTYPVLMQSRKAWYRAYLAA
jgi:hypothetical protein